MIWCGLSELRKITANQPLFAGMKICKTFPGTGDVEGGLEWYFIDVSNALSARYEVHGPEL